MSECLLVYVLPKSYAEPEVPTGVPDGNREIVTE
jgi:hypothetical protein